jgi:hypothetical protein
MSYIVLGFIVFGFVPLMAYIRKLWIDHQRERFIREVTRKREH